MIQENSLTSVYNYSTGTFITCQHCGTVHLGMCYRIKTIEYYPNGSVKKVEYHEPVSIHWNIGESR